MYYQEAPPDVAKRRLKVGHSLTKPEQLTGLATSFTIKCKCGWFTIGSYAEKERYDHIAWMHITAPMLLVAGSSDTLRPMRMETLQAIERSRTDHRRP